MNTIFCSCIPHGMHELKSKALWICIFNCCTSFGVHELKYERGRLP